MSAVSKVMSSKRIIKVNIDTDPSAMDVTELMTNNEVGSVLVVDAANNPMRIITERDLLKGIFESGKLPKDIAAKDFMTSPVLTVKTIDSIETASAKMQNNKVKKLLVLEQDGSLAGVVSATDIMRKLDKILDNDYDRIRFLKAILQ